MSRAILSGSQNMWQRYLVLWTEMTNAEPSNFRRCEALRTQPLFRRVQWLSQFVCQDQRKKEARFCKIWPMQKYNLTLLKNLHFLAFLNRNVIWELPFFSFQFGRRWNVQFGKWPFNRWPTTQSSKPSNSHFKYLLSWHFVCPPRRFGSFFLFFCKFSPRFLFKKNCCLPMMFGSHRLPPRFGMHLHFPPHRLLLCCSAFMARDLIYEKSKTGTYVIFTNTVQNKFSETYIKIII